MKRRLLAALVTLSLLLFSCLPASLAAASPYVGTWVCVGMAGEDGVIQTEVDGQKAADVFKVELKEDGTMSVLSYGETMDGTWVETEKGITATVEGEPADFVLKDNQLVATENGITIYLEKQKAKSGGLLSLLMGSKYVGHWVATAMDEGDGELFSEIDGVMISDMLSLTINKDGTMVILNDGKQTTTTWQQVDGGISAEMWGETVTMQVKNGQLVAADGGEIIYFDRAEGGSVTPQPTPKATANITPGPGPVQDISLAGVWEAVSYETMGYAFEAKALFPDGCTVVFNNDGTATAQITKDYVENLTWSQKDGAITIDGSYVLGDPKLDPETGRLTMTYGGSTVVVAFEKDAAADPLATIAPAPTDAPADELIAVVMKLFSAAYPKEGWVNNTSWLYDTADNSTVKFEKQDAGASPVASVTLTATSEGVDNYRDKIKELNGYLKDTGKDTLDEITVGGIVFQGASYEKWGWSYQEYTARVVEKSMTITILVEQPQLMGNELQPILNSVLFTLPILTPANTDPPMPEDGTPYVPTTTTLPFGKTSITATWLKSGSPIVLDSMYGNQIAFLGGKLYALTGSRLFAFGIDDDTLVPSDIFPEGMDLGGKYEYLSAPKDGLLYVSDGFSSTLALKDRALVNNSAINGDVTMHPSGEWGIAFWANLDPTIVRAKDGVLTTEPWILSNLSDSEKRKGRFSLISCVAISDDRIYVSGNDATNGDVQRVAAYDLNGKELFSLGGLDWTQDDALSSVSGMVETEKGLLVLDGNNRSLKLFDKKGKFVCAADLDALLGTSYPWLTSMIPAEDGGVLIAAAQTRQDESADELLIFHVTGF